MIQPLPVSPKNLSNNTISLLLHQTFLADEKAGLSPYYHYRIHIPQGIEVGHINFRIGESAHILNTAGHIGYAIHPNFRGNALSYYACLAILPLVRSVYSSIILTSDPDNAASLTIIKKLGGTYLNEVEVPPNDPAYVSGARIKCRYLLTL